jgi:hypothetical protein
MVTINWPAVLVATVLGFFLNGLWYSKPLFGPAWKKLSGLSDEALATGLWPRMGLALLGSFLPAWCLAGFFNFTHSSNVLMGAAAGLQLFLGLVLPAMAMEHLFARRPLKLLAINLAPACLALLFQGALLAVWK